MTQHLSEKITVNQFISILEEERDAIDVVIKNLRAVSEILHRRGIDIDIPSQFEKRIIPQVEESKRTRNNKPDLTAAKLLFETTNKPVLKIGEELDISPSRLYKAINEQGWKRHKVGLVAI